MRVGAVVLLAVAASCGRGEAEGPPVNLLLVTLDSVRPERFEAPERFNELPLALAHFREEATRFTGCIAAAPATLPAAASILTGRYPVELGRPAPGRVLPGDVPTLAEVLLEAGFDTAAFVAPCSLGADSGIARGFSHYDAPDGARREDYEVADAAREWLRERPRGTPWFAWVHLNAGHGPYRALETPFNPLHFFYKYNVLPAQGGAREIPFAKGNAGRGGVPSYQRMSSPAYFAAYRSYYDARVRVGDWFANELRHVLRFTGQYDTTAIVVVGTHGESLGEHGVEFDHGEDLFREVLEVPLLVRIPGREASEIGDTVSQVDLFPTLLGALRVGDIPPSSGRDLFDGGSDVALSELYPPIGPDFVFAATSGSEKVIRSRDATSRFDLEADPREERGHPVGEEDELARHLREHSPLLTPSTVTTPISQGDRARLRELGYVVARFEP